MAHLCLESAIAGTNYAYAPGDVVEWPNEDEAERLVQRGHATLLDQEKASQVARDSGKPIRKHREPKAPEAAMRTAPEAATQQRPMARR
jgi:hypothetical protein